MTDKALNWAPKSGGPFMQLYTAPHQFEAGFTFHQLTIVTQSTAFIRGLASTLWGKSRYSLIATACCPEGKYVTQ